MKKNNTSIALAALLLTVALTVSLKVQAQTNASATGQNTVGIDTRGTTQNSAIGVTGTTNGTGITTPVAPQLYNQAGTGVSAFNSSTNSLTPGWYYTRTGSPRYYYANGVYYDPATQSYGGSVLFPGAGGPQSLMAGADSSLLNGSSGVTPNNLNSPGPSTAQVQTGTNLYTGTTGTTGTSVSTGTTGSSGTTGSTGTTGTSLNATVGSVTPGVPNTGVGTAVYAWLALIVSAAAAVYGTRYLTRNAS